MENRENNERLKGQHAFSTLPVSGHPFNSALGTERACKRDREETEELSKIRAKRKQRPGNSSQTQHLNHRHYCNQSVE